MGSRVRAIILKNDLSVKIINNVTWGRVPVITYGGGDYVLSPDAVNRVIDLEDREKALGSEIIYFQNGSSPIPRDVDFSDQEATREKTRKYLNEAIIDNFLENTGFSPRDTPLTRFLSGLRGLSLMEIVLGVVGLSIAYSLIMGAIN